MKCEICGYHRRIVDEKLPICVDCWNRNDPDTLESIEFIKRSIDYEEKHDEIEDLFSKENLEF